MTSLRPLRPWRLAPHVRACYSEGQVILLDLRLNKYHGIADVHQTLLERHVERWPHDVSAHREPQPQPQPQPQGDIEKVARPLLAAGLLTVNRGEDSSVRSIQSPTKSMNALDATEGRITGQVNTDRVSRLLVSATRAALAMRFSSLQAMSEAVSARRSRLAPRSAHAEKKPNLDVQRAVAVYEWLRPLAFSVQGQCLYDSLCLLHYLSGELILPQLVIGVRTRPFGAHAWVQQDDTVLNDQHDYVRRFTPILVT